jgi:hypothetical protein
MRMAVLRIHAFRYGVYDLSAWTQAPLLKTNCVA